MFTNIKGKKVLVTGATGGIGASIVELFASQGALVGIHYGSKRTEANKLKARLLSKYRGKIEVFPADLRQSSSRKKLIPSFIKVFKGLDVLINNAGGIYGVKDFLKMDECSWDDTFDLNAKTGFFLARDAFNYMKLNGGGRIINISSIAAKYGGSNDSLHYGAAKAALEAVSKGLSRAGAEHNILVNTIRPGFINTSFHKKTGRRDKDIKKRIDLIPVKRAGKPKDIAQTALFLASGTGDYITGEIFTVAGGD